MVTLRASRLAAVMERTGATGAAVVVAMRVAGASVDAEDGPSPIGADDVVITIPGTGAGVAPPAGAAVLPDDVVEVGDGFAVVVLAMGTDGGAAVVVVVATTAGGALVVVVLPPIAGAAVVVAGEAVVVAAGPAGGEPVVEAAPGVAVVVVVVAGAEVVVVVAAAGAAVVVVVAGGAGVGAGVAGASRPKKIESK